jgi:ankyrin repeat protein
VAVEHDSADVVAALLVHGCDANARDAARKSCLHYAVSYGRREVLKLLLKPFFEWSGGRVATGADGDVDADKDTVRNRGVRGGDNPIAWAAEEGPKLIGGGRLSLDWQDDDGTTALVEAVKMRDDESASLLLRAGALVHPKDKDGMSGELAFMLQYATAFVRMIHNSLPRLACV